MAITREEVERMEEQAGLSRRFNAASDDYVARNNPRLRAMERESVLRTAEADVFNKARQRRIDSQRLVAIADPGRFSPFERNSLLGIDKNGGALIDRSERDILRQHELQMLRQQGFNSIGTEEAKARGLAMNGMEAARIGADSRVRAAEIGAAADVQKANLESGSAKARFGWFDESGTYHPGSDVNAAERTGAWQLGKQFLSGDQKLEQIDRKGEQTKSIQELKEDRKDIRQDKSIEALKDRRQTRDAQQEQRDFDNWINSVMDLRNGRISDTERIALRDMTPAEQRAYWIKKTGRQVIGAQPAAGAGNGRYNGKGSFDWN